MVPWARANISDPKKRCLALDLKDSMFALDVVECTADKNVICEVKDQTTKLNDNEIYGIAAGVRQTYLSCYLHCKRIVKKFWSFINRFQKN